MRNIFKKFGREGKNPGGGGIPPPLGRPKVDFYLGHLRVNISPKHALASCSITIMNEKCVIAATEGSI